MPKLKNINNVESHCDTPSKIWVCHCEQCRGVKNKRKNRKIKKKIKRLLNKKRRTSFDSGVVFYWA